MKRLLLLLVVLGLIAGVGSASAVINDAEAWRAFDNDPGFINDSTGNGHTLTNFGAAQVAGLLNEAADFDGTADYMNDTGYNFGGAFTWSAWINADDVSGGTIIDQSNGGFDNVLDLGTPASGDIRFALTGTTARVIIDSSTTPVTAGNWHHVVAWYDGSEMRIYVDNVEVASGAKTGSLDSTGYSDTQLGRQRTSNNFNGTIDEVGFYTRALSTAEIAELYNSGAGINPYSGVATEFLITAQDSYTTSSLTNFSATFSNGTTYTTTNGTINTGILSNSTSLYNITISSEEAGGYFNKTYNDYNVSSNLQASLHQAELTFRTYNKVSGDLLTGTVNDFELTTSSNGGSATSYDGTSGALQVGFIQILNLTAADNYAINYKNTGGNGWYRQNITGINASALETSNRSIDVYNHKANFSLNVISGSATENNFTLSIYSVEHDYTETLTTTSGNLIANLTHGNYTVWLNDSIHALQNYSVELNNSVNFTNVVLDSYTTNSVNIRFYDEETNNLIDDRNITAFFTGNIISYNRSTTNGTLFLDMINPQSYVITYDANGYSQREYSFTLTNRTFNELSLYLINESTDELILTSVIDSFLDPVPNAVIRAQKKNLSGTNYYNVESCKTDTNGECLLHLELYDTTYRFLVIKDGTTVLTSADQSIKSTSLTFQVNLVADTLEEINQVLGITGEVTYDKNNEQIEFTWNDNNGLGITACLDIDTRQGANKQDYNLSCTTSSSGTITLPIDTNLSFTYEATGYVIVDSNRYDIDSISVAGNNLSSGLGINGLFIFGFIVVGIAAFTGLWNPVVGPIIMASTVWFFNYIGFITVGTAAVTSLIIGAIMVAYLSRS